jgi:flagellar basal body P-ring formation protein FlgA
MKRRFNHSQIHIAALAAIAVFGWVLGLGLELIWPKDAAAGNVMEIRLKSSAEVGGRVVRLKDVSTLSHGQKGMSERLGRINVSEAPFPGKSRWVTVKQVQMGLRRSGVDAARYRILSSGPTRVRRRALQVKAQRICDAVKRHVQANAPWRPDQMKIKPITYSQDVTVADGRLSFQVKSPKYSDWLGSIPFKVLVFVDGKIAKKVTVPATIEVWSDVALAAIPLGKYQIIEAKHVRIEQMNLARVPENAVLHIEQAVGSRTNRNIAANSILRGDQLELPPVVKRGDVVQVVAESKRMKICVKARAKESGAKGKTIQVQNLRSKKTIYAQVLDSQTVQVEF